ncbi:MAG TPA: hypothetical protein PKI20_00845 [Verrucomicrobiota bacterium]|jgi:hypothetical protein|nr:hypothetical protein [Verrucomicrobiota bacterium]
MNTPPRPTIEANSLALRAGPEWKARFFSAPGAEGVVLTPTEAFKAQLEASTAGGDPVCSISLQLLRDYPATLGSLLDAEIKRRRGLDPALTIESLQCTPDAPECSCLIHYNALYPIDSPRAERLRFSLHCALSKRPEGVLRLDVRARDFFIHRAMAEASAILRTVVIKQ